ncbi:putative fimbrial subunit type 1 [Corynebacterium efficiens YS-314]|nr:SpaH/EbpB family LPXTG-anchored major pilin [Corynebacterium efficiens]EEW51034.1 putative fimbrial subunit type 1 [Corynebacterium efficiens YS-314]
MKTLKRRGLLAKAGALLAVAALAFSASPSYAQTNDVPETANVVITKLEQPTVAGSVASGQSQTLPEGSKGIEDVEFTAYRVPVYKAGENGDEHPARTSAWQQATADIDLDMAKSRVAELATPTEVALNPTNENGVTNWSAAAAGLYLIRETSTPAGVIPAQDFLLAVPMTNPEGTGWLTDIYVYPKGSTFSASKSVDNAASLKTGDPVTWTIEAGIPLIRSHTSGDPVAPAEFKIVDTFNTADLELVGGANGVTVTVPGIEFVTADYTVDVNPVVDGLTTVTITFNEGGLAKLVGKDDVTVELKTTVLKAGEINTTATITATDDTRATTVTDIKQTVKYGKVTLTKKNQNGQLAKDAVFRVYATEAHAKAKGDNHLITATNKTGIWKTGEGGKVILDGFRFSDFADGADQVKGADGSLYQTYWLVEMTAPAGQQLLAEPVPFTVTEVEDTLEVTNTANTNAFVLPLTGGTGTAMLTILGLGILAIVLFVARSRRNAEA